jgi:hypothetical protein
MINLLDAICSYNVTFLSINDNKMISARPLLVLNLDGRIYSQIQDHTGAELVPVL